MTALRLDGRNRRKPIFVHIIYLYHKSLTTDRL